MQKGGGRLDMTGLQKSKVSRNRKLLNDIVRADVLNDEIEYAKSQLQPHDTGHIYTAISWMEHRLEELKGIEEDDVEEISKSLKLTKTEDVGK